MHCLSDFDVATLEEDLARRGCVASQAGKLLRAYYKGNGVANLASLEVGKRIEALLGREIGWMQSRIADRVRSADGTEKLLLAMQSGGAVEAVMMPSYRAGEAAGCLSSQIGCAMGCDFCASTRGGLERNLEAGEIVEQYLHLKRIAAEAGRRIRTVVFMGMGEPMHNLANVMAAIVRIAGQDMGALGWRQVMVSTVGIVPGIEALADSGVGVYLAISLHAADDATRARIVPTSRRYRIAEILAAAQRYQEKTGRTVNIEYCLLEGVNDSDGQARLLAQRIADKRFHVNVIPYNAIRSGISGEVYRRPTDQRIERFVAILREGGVVAHIRRRRGEDVDAACGQLRQRYVAQEDRAALVEAQPR